MSKQQKFDITSKKQLTLSQNYKHQIDTRTQKQISLSNYLIRALSQLNLQRIQKKQNERQKSQQKTMLANQYTFICLTGAPKLDKQFQNIQVPGQKIIYAITGMEGQYSKAQYQQILQNISYEKEAIRLSHIINNVNPDRKIIIVFHQFGSFILLTYIKKFGNQKIKGLIDVGGIPITMYTLVKIGLKVVQPFSTQQLLQKRHQIYEVFIHQIFGKLGSPFKNKIHGIIFMKFFKEKECQEMFQLVRNYPKILKLIIFGRRDILFQEKLLNQKAVHYCYVNKLSTQTEQQLSNSYEKVYGSKVKNVQQRFIFNIESGSHSVHCQPKLVKTLNSMIKQYIEVLDIYLSNQKVVDK